MTKNAMQKIVHLNMSGLLFKLRIDFNVVENVRHTTVVISNTKNDGAVFCVNVSTKGRVQVGLSFDNLGTICEFTTFKSYNLALGFLDNYVNMSCADLKFEFSYKN